MGIYKIFDHGEEINRIVADEEFVKMWCPENGYTYELEPGPEPVPPEPTYTADDLLYALLGDTLAHESVGGVTPSETLAALGPDRYNALSALLHAWGLCVEVDA